MSPRKTQVIEVPCVHISMQFGDTTAQKKSDVEAIFKRARAEGAWWITGTEAGPGSGQLPQILREAAKKHGWYFYLPPKTDGWIAFREDKMADDCKPDGFLVGPVIASKAGKHTARGVVGLTVQTKEIGEVTVLTSHYLTKGRPGASREYSANVDQNRELAQAIGRVAREKGKGSAKVFYGGDQNIVDIMSDTFFGEPITSIWDELKFYQNTGHGNIDVIASYDHDKAVSAKSIRAYTDKQFFLNTDHYYVKGVFEVRVAA